MSLEPLSFLLFFHDAVGTAGAARGYGVAETFAVALDGVFVASSLVIEVILEAGKEHVASFQPYVVEPGGKFPVLFAPRSERLVIAVDFQRVLAPEGHVAAYELAHRAFVVVAQQ